MITLLGNADPPEYIQDNEREIDTGTRVDYYEQTAQFYDACADHYEDLYPDHVEASRRAAKTIAPIFKDSGVRNILDASCGKGHDIVNFASHGFQVDGTDVSPRMLSLAEQRLERRGLDNTALHRCDIRNLAGIFPSGKYDAVIFRGNTLSNLEHSDYGRAFEAVSRVLRPGGLFYVDFRDGRQHFRENRKFEFRGIRWDASSRSLRMAWYKYRHGRSIEDTFRVTATLLSMYLTTLPVFRRTTCKINSHYVPEVLVKRNLRREGFRIIEEVDVSSGLPYLTTYVAQKVR